MLSVLSMSFLHNVLIGSRPPCQGVEFATMEYWVRLRVPMDQAIRLYRVSMFKVSNGLWFYVRHDFPS